VETNKKLPDYSGITKDSLGRENEELKATLETYRKEYKDMIAEVLRLSGENSKMKQMIADRIKELE